MNSGFVKKKTFNIQKKQKQKKNLPESKQNDSEIKIRKFSLNHPSACY